MAVFFGPQTPPPALGVLSPNLFTDSPSYSITDFTQLLSVGNTTQEFIPYESNGLYNLDPAYWAGGCRIFQCPTYSIQILGTDGVSCSFKFKITEVPYKNDFYGLTGTPGHSENGEVTRQKKFGLFSFGNGSNVPDTNSYIIPSAFISTGIMFPYYRNRTTGVPTYKRYFDKFALSTWIYSRESNVLSGIPQSNTFSITTDYIFDLNVEYTVVYRTKSINTVQYAEIFVNNILCKVVSSDINPLKFSKRKDPNFFLWAGNKGSSSNIARDEKINSLPGFKTKAGTALSSSFTGSLIKDHIETTSMMIETPFIRMFTTIASPNGTVFDGVKLGNFKLYEGLLDPSIL